MLTLDAIDAHLLMLGDERRQQKRTTPVFWATWWEDVDAELDARLALTGQRGGTPSPPRCVPVPARQG